MALHRNRRRSYRHLRSLIGVLDVVCPAATEDPEFLHRSLLVEGVSHRASPRDLMDTFPLPVQAAVLVRDAEFRDHVGLVVLQELADRTVAAAAAPRPGFFCSLIRVWLGALDIRASRQGTADLLRSMIPPDYLATDTEMSFHLSCVFLRGRRRGRRPLGGAHALCSMAASVILAREPMKAVIFRRAENAAVLVYCDAESTEMVVTRASHLRQHSQSSLMMYDVSLFPLPAAATAAAAGGEAGPAWRLLPPFVTGAATDYLGRVMLLMGLDTQDWEWEWDAAKLADLMELRVGVSDLEAVIVHRQLGAVLLVLGRYRDAEILRRESEQQWARVFSRPVAFLLVPEQDMRRRQPPLPRFLSLDLMRHCISPTAYELVGLRFNSMVDECPDQDFRGLTRGLDRLAALWHPHALRRAHFSSRAVLLTGIGGSPPGGDVDESALHTALSRYGSLDALTLYGPRRIALAAFTSWRGATRLLRVPADVRLRFGLGDCRAALDSGFASVFEDTVLEYLLYYHYQDPTSGRPL
ncbi:hypothetical protein BS78_02G359700 [Paspalum vaginatum]|nr:hypothetical protein BS78_02G359700 [Paspalum vaginatum]